MIHSSYDDNHMIQHMILLYLQYVKKNHAMCEKIFLVYMLILKSYVILKILIKQLYYSVTKRDIELGFSAFER